MANGELPGVALATYTEPNASEWRYNELRTLRMEYELFGQLQQTFAREIEANRQRDPRPQISWEQLAGRAWNSSTPEANARIGLGQSLQEWRQAQNLTEAQTILQIYNASNAREDERLVILNNWLRSHSFRDSAGQYIKIEAWSSSVETGNSSREQNIGWIPARSYSGVLLPRDE